MYTRHNTPKIDKLLFNFLWDNKPPKIKRSTIIAPIEQGGLAMIDVYEVHAASKFGWIKRLYDDSNSKWKVSFLHMLNIGKNLLNQNLDLSMVNCCKSDFHKQILEAWIKMHSKEPKNYNEIVHQFLVYNKEIKIDKNS